MIDPKARWNQILQYYHRIPDLEKFAAGRGPVHVYHGAPTTFAKELVLHGPRIPYTVYGVARRVALLYGLNWSQFEHYAHRRAEKVSHLSTAPAPIACRWAWGFGKGEILTDLNSNAMMVVASNALAKSKGISVSDAYEELYNKAIVLARTQGTHATNDSAPHILGLRDKMKLEDETGSLVQIDIDVSGIEHERNAQDSAEYYLREIRDGNLPEADALAFWNNEYKDMWIQATAIRAMRIVITGMERWEQDAIEDMFRNKELPIA